jgi:hypothetical protein
MQYYRTVTTDQHGGFALNDLSPGTYKLFAWDQVEFDAWMDKEFIDQFDDRGEPLRISQRTRSEIQLQLITADRSSSAEGRDSSSQMQGLRRRSPTMARFQPRISSGR